MISTMNTPVIPAFLLGSLAASAIAATIYVSPLGTHLPPFDTWSKAATNIQDGVNAAVTNDVVLVSNGVYATGSTWDGQTFSRLVIGKAVTVRSLSGPAETVIEGCQTPPPMRCVWMTNGSLEGFTVSNGYALDMGHGGGVYAMLYPLPLRPLVSNCVITMNIASNYGGGIAGGILVGCRVAGNVSLYAGGGSYFSDMYGCTLESNQAYYAGGIYQGLLANCVVRGNAAITVGGVDGCLVSNCLVCGNSGGIGGTTWCTVYNSVICHNQGGWFGGGSYIGTLVNCLVVSNWAVQGGGANRSVLLNCTVCDNIAVSNGGGVWGYDFSNVNCIIYHNVAADGSNWYHDYTYGSNGFSYNSVCTEPAPPESLVINIITNDPGLVGRTNGDYHPPVSSPCINTGVFMAWMTGATDLDGGPRVQDGLVDLGCYELVPEPAAAIAAALLAALCVTRRRP